MSQSTVVEWLNENTQRAYPFTEDSERYVNVNGTMIDMFGVVVDANLVYYNSTMPSQIKLTSITRTQAGDVDHVTIFITDVWFLMSDPPTDPESYPVYVRTVNGLLVFGPEMANLLNALTTHGTVAPNLTFEPSIAIELSGLTRGVQSVSFAANNITTGDITLVNGYQTLIQFVDQAIQLTVGRNQGQVLGCESFFTEADDCNAVVSNINGASPGTSGGIVKLVAGEHIKIFEDPERARIYIGLDFGPTDTCVAPTLPPAP